MIYFISGIDTDIGKTYATGLMAASLQRAGVRVVTQKLVQTGNVSASEDIQKHRDMMGLGVLPEDLDGSSCPQIFRFPASPHLAAKLENRTVDLDKIDRSSAILSARFDVVLLEGAGGLMVPLREDLLTIDYAKNHHYPVILVTSGRLGSLNHTILSIEALKTRDMALAGVVYNCFPIKEPLIEEDSFRMIRLYLDRYGYDRTPLVKLPEVKAGTTADFQAIFDGGEQRL